MILLDPPPAEWEPLPAPDDDLCEASLWAAGAARVKLLVYSDRLVEPAQGDDFPDELRETLEARGAPNGIQMEYPLMYADDVEEFASRGVQGTIWRLAGGTYTKRPPPKGWNTGGEHLVAAGLVVKGECRLFALGGPPDAVEAAAPAFEAWIRSARAARPDGRNRAR